MSLLQQDSSRIDDAARGEELTKGSGHLVAGSIIAAVVVSLGIAIYFISGIRPPVITGEIEQVWVHPQHSETSGFDANGAPMATESIDQVYVFAQIKLHNKSSNPVSLQSIMTNATLDDGIHSSYAATATDYDRLFLAFPYIPVPHGNPLSPKVTINPGQTVEGTIVSAFRVTREQWDARKSLDFTFGMQYQPSLTVAPQTALIVR
jgi:hypothetical protein